MANTPLKSLLDPLKPFAMRARIDLLGPHEPADMASTSSVEHWLLTEASTSALARPWAAVARRPLHLRPRRLPAVCEALIEPVNPPSTMMLAALSLAIGKDEAGRFAKRPAPGPAPPPVWIFQKIKGAMPRANFFASKNGANPIHATAKSAIACFTRRHARQQERTRTNVN